MQICTAKISFFLSSFYNLLFPADPLSVIFNLSSLSWFISESVPTVHLSAWVDSSRVQKYSNSGPVNKKCYSYRYSAPNLSIETSYDPNRCLPNRLLPTPRPRASVAPPFWFQEGDTLACGRGGRGSQFEGSDRYSGTLGIVQFNPSTILSFLF